MAEFRRPQMIIGGAALVAALSLAAALQAAAAEIRNLAQPGAFAIDASPSGASFAKQGRIEQQTARGWEPVFEEFRLVEDCGAVATLPACVTLAPGASLRPVPWTGYTCRGQCPRPCKGNVYRPPGTFRLVLPLCGGGAVTGPPFPMGARPKR
ncbi:MAG: hypothetical protein ACJ8DQ_09200 [Xanthobacteraceae bacterium]